MERLESPLMNESEDGAAAAQVWLAHLLRSDGTVATEAGSPVTTSALAALAVESMARGRTALLLTADDQPLPDISNALDLDLRPLCLVLPAANHVCRIAMRATLSLLRSRLARAGQDVEGPVWQAERQRLERESSLWQACLAWNERGLDDEPWPADIARLFPVRIMPMDLARRLSMTADWAVIDAARTAEQAAGPWPGARRTLFLRPRAEAFVGGRTAVMDPVGRKRAELEVLTQELSELELELATAQAEIAEFSRRYHTLVGTRMARLDDIHARLAARRAAAEPRDFAAARAADAAWAQAEQTRRENRQFADLDAGEAAPFAPAGALKKLFRKLAQKIHPDRARDEQERAWRTQLMAEANRAYRNGDEAGLLEILALWQESAGQRSPEGDGSRLDAQLEGLRRRIAEIEAELNRLFGSKLYELHTAARIGRRAGRDLLQEMADKLDAEIAAASTTLG